MTPEHPASSSSSTACCCAIQEKDDATSPNNDDDDHPPQKVVRFHERVVIHRISMSNYKAKDLLWVSPSDLHANKKHLARVVKTLRAAPDDEIAADCEARGLETYLLPACYKERRQRIVQNVLQAFSTEDFMLASSHRRPALVATLYRMQSREFSMQARARGLEWQAQEEQDEEDHCLSLWTMAPKLMRHASVDSAGSNSHPRRTVFPTPVPSSRPRVQ